MSDYEPHLARWQSAGLLDGELAARIREFELGRKRPAGLQWQVIAVLILGGILLAAGVALFVSAHWDEISPLTRYLLVMAMVAVFHLGGGLARARFTALATTLHAVGTLATGAAIALVGQIFNIQEHWPAAVLLWAIAALAGWALLRDQAQQTIALLLVPAWLLSELADRTEHFVGSEVYMGRLLLSWAVLYLTLFLGSRRRVVWGILFFFSAVAAIVGTDLLFWSWTSWGGHTAFLPLGIRIWCWIAIAALPLGASLLQRGKSLAPVAVSILLGLVLPWCNFRFWHPGNRYAYGDGPNIVGFALAGGFALFLTWWGVQHASRALVNLSILGFAIDVTFFYFSNLFDKLGRSLGLIGLGVLFLAGGWLLERMRRRLMAQIASSRSQGVAEGAI